MAEADDDGPAPKAKAGGTSLIGKLAGLRARLPAKGKAKVGAKA